MKIFTLNAWLLPFAISKDNKKRLKRIINFIDENDFEIILLQEVWLNSYVKDIKFKTRFKYNLYIGNNKLFNKSGLVTLVRKDIKVSDFELVSFPKNSAFNLEERFAAKGFQILKVNKDNLEFNLINLHLYAPKKKKESSLPKLQLKQILTRSSDSKVIIGGDFNLTIENIKDQLPHKPISNDFTITKANKYQNSRLNKYSTNEFKIDHIITSGFSNAQIVNEIVEKNGFSDHFGQISEFKFDL